MKLVVLIIIWIKNLLSECRKKTFSDHHFKKCNEREHKNVVHKWKKIAFGGHASCVFICTRLPTVILPLAYHILFEKNSVSNYLVAGKRCVEHLILRLNINLNVCFSSQLMLDFITVRNNYSTEFSFWFHFKIKIYVKGIVQYQHALKAGLVGQC